MAVVILGTVRLPPDRLGEARPDMAAMVAASLAEAGCLEYAYAEDVLEPGLIRVSEVWRDQASLDRHAQSDHIKTWRAAWPALGLHDRRLVAYEAGASRPL
ncbi:MAG TPA: putative quinol monooxygenase [Caulobacteraceae bacterium]|jgi:quinol monooxygenase YgiN|nr:putative quinol monooxygenase [Caulobacteraceae bacterium]